MRIDDRRKVEVLGAMKVTQDDHTKNERLPCHYVPMRRSLDERTFCKEGGGS